MPKKKIHKGIAQVPAQSSKLAEERMVCRSVDEVEEKKEEKEEEERRWRVRRRKVCLFFL